MNNYLASSNQTSNYSNIDVAKFICALWVVFIHTSPLCAISDIAHFYTTEVLCRVAVPLFYGISGYLFFRKLHFENGRIKKSSDNLRKLLQYWRRNAILYLTWTAVYILFVQVPAWYQLGWWGLHVIKDCLSSILFVGSYYHLWYLLSMVYAMPVLYLILRHFDIRKISWLVAFLWICECLLYSYSWIGLDRLPLYKFISSRFPIFFDSMFRAIPLLFVGAWLSQKKLAWTLRKNWLPALIALLLCNTEATVLFLFSQNQDKYSYLFSTPVVSFTWLLFLIQSKQCSIPLGIQRACRKASLLIYCVHPLILVILDYCGVSAGMPMFVIVFLLSVLYCFLYYRVSENQKK